MATSYTTHAVFACPEAGCTTTWNPRCSLVSCIHRYDIVLRCTRCCATKPLSCRSCSIDHINLSVDAKSVAFQTHGPPSMRCARPECHAARKLTHCGFCAGGIIGVAVSIIGPQCGEVAIGLVRCVQHKKNLVAPVDKKDLEVWLQSHPHDEVHASTRELIGIRLREAHLRMAEEDVRKREAELKRMENQAKLESVGLGDTAFGFVPNSRSQPAMNPLMRVASSVSQLSVKREGGEGPIKRPGSSSEFSGNNEIDNKRFRQM